MVLLTYYCDETEQQVEVRIDEEWDGTFTVDVGFWPPPDENDEVPDPYGVLHHFLNLEKWDG